MLVAREDVSKKELAAKIGSDPNTVSSHLRGRISPGVEYLEKYASFFDVTIDRIVSGFDLLDHPPGPIEAIELSEGEGELLEIFRRLTDENRQFTIEFVKKLSRQ
jgi:transcriptional regulator with XRE-family HTH domain